MVRQAWSWGPRTPHPPAELALSPLPLCAAPCPAEAEPVQHHPPHHPRQSLLHPNPHLLLLGPVSVGPGLNSVPAGPEPAYPSE